MTTLEDAQKVLKEHYRRENGRLTRIITKARKELQEINAQERLFLKSLVRQRTTRTRTPKPAKPSIPVTPPEKTVIEQPKPELPEHKEQD